MKNRRKYKFQGGIQRIENDTPDYSNAYKLRAEQNAKSQVGQNIGAAAANIAMPGLGSAMQGVGAISDAAFKDAKGNYKNKFSEIANTYTNPLATAGKAVSALTGDKTAAADLFSGLGVTAGLQALGVKNPFGKTTQEKVKDEAIAEEKRTAMANINKRYSEGTATDAQAALAKKGKYKVKTKQPRLIETEGREPIFSPKDKNGKRKLLYYNPNDPTHEEGGVKAVVMPKNRYNNGTNNLEGDIISKVVMNRNKDKDFVKRTQATNMFKTWDDFDTKATHKMAYGEDDRGQSYMFPTIMNPKNEAIKVPNQYADYISSKGYKKATGMMAVGAKQLKVNNLNNTAFTENLGGMPAVNAANKFVQPMAGIQQVARNIPEARRKEKIGTPRSHKKSYKQPIEDPPTTYDMMPKPPLSRINKETLSELKLPKPRSTFNTKNDFKKGGSYIRTYQEGTEAAATYKHTKTFKSKPAYQAALQAHDDSLNLYGQSRYFTDKVKESGLYNSTVENPAVKNITRTGTGRTASPLKTYGAPDDTSEEIMTIAGMNPMRKDLYSRKESKYKSFKEYEEAKAAGNPEKHEGYEINMYKHPEMALKYEPDTAQSLQIKKPKLNVTKDTATVRKPRMVTNTTDTTSKQDKEVVALNKTRGKFVGREKTFFEKAGEFLDKVGPSNRMSNGKKVKVYK